MSESKNYTYRLKVLSLFIAVWEFIFWILAYQLLYLLGFFSTKSGEKINFLYPEYAWLFLLVIPLIGGLLYFSIKRNKFVKGLTDKRLATTFLKTVSTKLLIIRYFFIRNIWVFLVLALMQPVFGERMVQGKASGVELVFALDISNSMNAKDLTQKTSRLTAAKRAITQIVNSTNSAKVGIIVFAGSVYPHLPLTPDKSLAKLYIDQIETDLISNQGTNTGLALDLAADFFTKDPLRKAVVLITDGEDHEGGVDDALEKLSTNNIDLFVLGLGTEKGALVPADAENPSAGYLKDNMGQSVISKINEELIISLAEQSNGEAIISSDAYPNVSSILTLINNSNATKQVDLEFKVKENRYRLPLIIALIMMVMYYFISFYKIRTNSNDSVF